ncbi:putative phage tail component, N-terminal domain-containing protein [Pilibacter termitis]|uniref:Putative phage tail component, N-terminal domain-containing protein n=1 Tax=Pilibacter termitis TaxID=263852 RepID=A0A1T4PEJ6_9ENTE|nr:distal tail protein Dit [Pilibacter termitis]SJZ89970.1 putative phage tail component, N-terminal domain-containing protein [Pilibacter termitis]
MKSDLKIFYGGQELTAFFDLLEAPKRNLIGDVTNNLVEFQAKDGGELISTRRGALKITLEIFTDSFTFEKRELLKGILYNHELKKLTFSDEENRYYMAILDGESSFIRDLDNSQEATGVLTFLVPDGVSYSTYKLYKEGQLVSKTDDKGNAYQVMTVEVTNDGTAPCEIDYEITHPTENGYVGIVSAHGAIEIGDKFEADREQYEQSEMVCIDDSNAIVNAWSTDTGYTTDDRFNIIGSAWRLITEPTGSVWATQYYSGSGNGGNNGASNLWHLARKSRTLTPTSDGKTAFKNFTVRNRIAFETSKSDQNGLYQVVLSTQDGRWRMGYYFCKEPNAKNEVRFTRFVYDMKDGVKKMLVEDSTYFTPNGSGKHEGSYGHSVYFEKFGGKVTWYDYVRKREFIVPEIANVEFSRLTISGGVYGRTTNRVWRMNTNSITVQVHKVEKERDIPNRYPEGSVLRIEGETRKVNLDNIPILTDVVQVPKFFSLPPKEETKIEFYFSEWIEEMPDVKIFYREKWL